MNLDLTTAIAAYKDAAPRYIRGRIGAARLLEADPRLSDEQRAYWKALADGLEKLLAK